MGVGEREKLGEILLKKEFWALMRQSVKRGFGSFWLNGG